MRISEAATGVGEQMADVGLAMQRAVDKTENMKARADAVSELEAAGTFEDLTQLGEGQDDIDRQLHELASSSVVDSDLERMKAELASGAPASAGELGAGEAPAPAERRRTPASLPRAGRRARRDRPDLRRGSVPPRRRRARGGQRARQRARSPRSTPATKPRSGPRSTRC